VASRSRGATGLWDINSVGEVASGSHHYPVAVVSDGNASMAGGIAASNARPARRVLGADGRLTEDHGRTSG